MKIQLSIYLLICLFGTVSVTAQTNQNDSSYSMQLMDSISKDTEKIARSIQTLNERLKQFSETFSSNQGLRLTERQQKLLVAFEFLNRAEQRLANLQTYKIELAEKLSKNNIKLAEIEDQLRPESIDRSVAMRGTTNAEELRSNRRQVLYREKNELNVLINQIQSSIIDADKEISETNGFLSRIRNRIFPEIEKELQDL